MEGMPEVNTSVAPDRFQELHSRRDRLYRAVALAVGDSTLAADAIDEAMTRAYTRWNRIELYASPEGWVYRVAMNVARSALRKTRREDLWEQPPAGDHRPKLESQRLAHDVPFCAGARVCAHVRDCCDRRPPGVRLRQNSNKPSE